MIWLVALSGRQRLWLVLVPPEGLLTVAAGAVHQRRTAHGAPVAFNVDMSIQQIAPQLNVTGTSLGSAPRFLIHQ